MNDLDFATRIALPGARHNRAHLQVVAAHPRPLPAQSRRSVDSGPALTRYFRAILVWSDLAVIVVAAGITGVLSYAANEIDAAARAMQPLLVALVVATWLALLWILRTRDSRVLCVGVAEYKRIMNASAMTFGVLAIAFVIAQVDAARFYFLLTLPLGMTGLVINRLLWRRWLTRKGEAGQTLSRVLVVGTRAEVDYVVRQIARKTGAAYSVVGTVVENGTPGIGPDGIPVTADLDTVAVRACELHADAVIVAGAPRGRSNYVHDLAWSLEGMATNLIIATNLANVAGPRIHLRPVEGLPLIHVEIPQFEGGRHALKRGLDVIVAGGALVVLAPLLLVIAAVIAHDSPGSPIFRQERVGRDGRVFTMLKFRSMVDSAESQLDGLTSQNQGNGVLFKLRNDPRVTRVGAFLRRHSLDELPQLWNILTGDMSLVGPRPPLPGEVRQYENHVHRRLYIRPGLTGMWQVNGRSTLNWEESVQLDLFYVENWSLIGDFVIMWRTVREVRKPAGSF